MCYIFDFFRVLSSPVPISVLQWDLTGDVLLVADQAGCVRFYRTRDHLLNNWYLAHTVSLQGEHIIGAAFFHSGKKVPLIRSFVLRCSVCFLGLLEFGEEGCFVVHRKVSIRPICMFGETIRWPARFRCVAVDEHEYAGRGDASSPHNASATGRNDGKPLRDEKLNIERRYLLRKKYVIKIRPCTNHNRNSFPDGHFLLAVTSGNINLPILCYKVSVKKTEEKCVITSQPLPGFFLQDGPTKDSQGYYVFYDFFKIEGV